MGYSDCIGSDPEPPHHHPIMDASLEAVLTAYRTFRDATNEDLFFEITERTPEVQALFDVLMDLEDEYEA